MSKIFVLLSAFLLCCASAHSGLAASKAPAEPALTPEEALMAQVEKRYAKIHSLECAFTQSSKNGGRLRTSRGKAHFFKPAGQAGDGSVIRWEYFAPELQTIVNDGKEIRIYIPAEKQLFISPASGFDTDMAYALFTGQKAISATFHVRPALDKLSLSPEPAGARAVLLEPKTPQEQLKQAQVWVDKNFMIVRLVMEDYFEAVTELNFELPQANTIKEGDSAHIAALRRLDIPEGTEIIRQ